MHGGHTLFVAKNLADLPSVTGAPANPILYRGVGHVSSEQSKRIFPILRGNPTSYSANPFTSFEQPESAGVHTYLVSALQARNQARVTLSGSLDMCSNQFMRRTVTVLDAGSSQNVISTNGNQRFCESLFQWTFQQCGQLRVRDIVHQNLDTKEVNPSSYRIKSMASYSAVIEEYDASANSWKPFVSDGVQLEFFMWSPWYRLNLKHQGAGVYSTQFQLPDIFGIYKYQLKFNGLGYTTLDAHNQVELHPFRHNEFERFIFAAFPYYGSAFSMMIGFFVFSVFFLYGRVSSDERK